jgi:hypothetical protein
MMGKVGDFYTHQARTRAKNEWRRLGLGIGVGGRRPRAVGRRGGRRGQGLSPTLGLVEGNSGVARKVNHFGPKGGLDRPMTQ